MPDDTPAARRPAGRRRLPLRSDAVTSRFRLFSDPVHGFVSVPKGLILSLVETPEFQRLRRIRQLGLGFLAFPGAVHTRFEHGLGAMALMQDALDTLRETGTVMTTDEVEGALAAALLHDLGHGPFSHTLEQDLVVPGADGVPHHHEAMSRALIARMNDRLGGALACALDIFDGTHDRTFFHDLVASQLDMDRLDYLRRDSFYTGVAEGVVGVDRVIKTMRVHDGRVVVEAKGAYAVENVLLSRRLMYWQVYLHKTVVGADYVLRAAVARARTSRDPVLDATAPAFRFFLDGRATADRVDEPATLDAFTALDDTDVLYSLKRWTEARDPVLADLARRLTLRDLFRTVTLDAPATANDVATWRDAAAEWLVEERLSSPADAATDAALYVHTGEARVSAYRPGVRAICVLERDGRVRDLRETADAAAGVALSEPATRAFVCLPKPLADRLFSSEARNPTAGGA